MVAWNCRADVRAASLIKGWLIAGAEMWLDGAQLQHIVPQQLLSALAGRQVGRPVRYSSGPRCR